MSDEASLEKTPDSGGVRAIEDAPPSAGVLARPTGPPTVLGPANWRNEGRGSSSCHYLPSESTELLPGETPTASPPRERAEAFKAILQGLINDGKGKLGSAVRFTGPESTMDDA